MSDIALDHFRAVLDDQPPTHQNDNTTHYDFHQWYGEAHPDSYETAVTSPDWPDDIENIYTGLHRCVDQVVATISVRAPPRLDRIKEQNRKVMDKLRTLESSITGDPAAAASSTPRAHGSDRSRTSRDKRRRVSLPKAAPGNARPGHAPRAASNGFGADMTPASLRYTQSGPDASSNPHVQPNRTEAPGPLFSGLEGDSKLARKLQQIEAEEARSQVAEFAAHLRAPGYQNALPTISQLSNVSQMTDASHFRQLVLGLGMAIESSIFGEQNSRIRKRIALAHFYHAYALAQEYPELFLSWCDNQRVQGGSMLPKGGNRSIVQHRFADLIFPAGEGQDGVSDAKKRTLKIQVWRKSGKKWAQLIERFGYGILLLLPSSLSDEDLRVAHDKDISYCLDILDSQRHLFADLLQEANDLLHAHFFLRDENGHLRDWQGVGRPIWNDFLKYQARMVNWEEYPDGRQ